MKIIQTSCDSPKAKLLYLSGFAQPNDGTFDALFSKSTLENNFRQLFHSHSVETYACEYSKTDTHFEVYNKARNFVIKNDIDFVFGFCYGSFPALHCAVKTTVKGVILLDTSTEIPEWSNRGITANLCKPTPPINMDFINCPVKLFYSEWGNANKNERGLNTKYLKNLSVEVIPDSTHAIMLEPQRITLMNKIMEFIDAELSSVHE